MLHMLGGWEAPTGVRQLATASWTDRERSVPAARQATRDFPT